MAALTEFADQLEFAPMLDRHIGPIKKRHRGLTAGEFLLSLGAAQLCGEDGWVPARVIRHARALTLRLPPGPQLLPEVLTRLRELPAAT